MHNERSAAVSDRLRSARLRNRNAKYDETIVSMTAISVIGPSIINVKYLIYGSLYDR
jgi:hypothetical protein